MTTSPDPAHAGGGDIGAWDRVIGRVQPCAGVVPVPAGVRRIGAVSPRSGA